MRADSRKHHVIYKTTCLVTGRYYIGMHSTDDLEDGYIGSGKRLLASIKKYGKSSHDRVILVECPTRTEMAVREKELVTPELLLDPLCMNLKIGGEGGGKFPSSYGRIVTAETRSKIAKAVRNQSTETRMKKSLAAKNMSDEWRKKLSTARLRPCTVDGVTIYPSVTELCAALGQGKAGYRNPDFRYVGS